MAPRRSGSHSRPQAPRFRRKSGNFFRACGVLPVFATMVTGWSDGRPSTSGMFAAATSFSASALAAFCVNFLPLAVSHGFDFSSGAAALPPQAAAGGTGAAAAISSGLGRAGAQLLRPCRQHRPAARRMSAPSWRARQIRLARPWRFQQDRARCSRRRAALPASHQT